MIPKNFENNDSGNLRKSLGTLSARIRESYGAKCPAERLNGKRYSDCRLTNLLVASRSAERKTVSPKYENTSDFTSVLDVLKLGISNLYEYYVCLGFDQADPQIKNFQNNSWLSISSVDRE